MSVQELTFLGSPARTAPQYQCFASASSRGKLAVPLADDYWYRETRSQNVCQTKNQPTESLKDYPLQ